MIELRPFASLGAADHGWLDAHHHFSFGDYHDPERVHWGDLRVWNDDAIAPRTGFPAHPHRDMEIITYVLEGAITHEDSLGNRGRTEAGDVQVMSAGTGVTHAEYNMEDEATHSFQLWILPDSTGGAPRWDTRAFPRDARAGRFVPLASGHAEDTDGGEGALPINADARVLGATVAAGDTFTYRLGAARKGYLVAARGAVEVDGVRLSERDGAAIADVETLQVKALEDSELVLVDTA